MPFIIRTGLFIPFQCECIPLAFFSCLTPPYRTYSTMGSKSEESRDSWLVPNFRAKTFSLFSYDGSCRFFVVLLF
jgi:hypothetical protein